MTISEHYFEADAAIIARLGRELVAKQETALIELVKNSFDADATEVSVTFMLERSIPSMEIRDNGSGMSKSDLVEGFLRLASDKKVSEPVSPLYKRRRAGRKGIGRFSTHRLGDRLVLSTRNLDEATGWRLEINWTKFSRGTELSAVPVTITAIDMEQPGTIIRIEQLFDDWSDATIKRCWRNVLRLQQPFPVAPIKDEPITDPGFAVRFLRENTLFNDETVVADLKSEILDHMHAVVEFKVDERGHASWRISKNRFAFPTDWKMINSYTPDSRDPQPYRNLKNAWMKTHYVILSPELLPSFVYSRVRDELASYGGVRLYRNGFRVVPYGDEGNDWLGLDELYAKRTFLAPISNRNFFGVVEVKDPDGHMFEEHTSREGLLETSAFAELKHLTSAVLVTAAGAISDARGKKTRASDKKIREPQNLGKLKSAVDMFVSATVSSSEEEYPVKKDKSVSVAAEKVIAIAEELQEELKEARIQLADETAMLRLLATLGMTTAEFSHETGMTFDAFRFDFERVFTAALAANENDLQFTERAARARGMLDRLETLTAYLNSLASSRSARDIRPVSLSKVVEEFYKGISAQATTLKISINIEVPEYDPLYTAPLHEAEIASILLNLYTNSVKAMKRCGKERRIKITASRLETESMVRLLFSDTGDGIVSENRERIFDAFFTTTIASPGTASDSEHAKGTGLGLWIVNQIAANANGEISVVEPENGYFTSFELLLPKENEDA